MRAAALILAFTCAAATAQAPHDQQHRFDDAEKWAHVFDDPARDAWQKPHEVIEALALAPDATVADIGAGTGYFATRLARMLPKARVYAVDLQPEMVKHLSARAQREGLANLAAVQAAAGDARLPAPVDLALLVNVYHHLDGRSGYFTKLQAARVAIIDFRPDSKLGPREGRVAPGTVKQELAAAGYTLAAQHDFLPEQYFLVFAAKQSR